MSGFSGKHSYYGIIPPAMSGQVLRKFPCFGRKRLFYALSGVEWPTPLFEACRAAQAPSEVNPLIT